jgi:hypothetical protein
VWEPNEERPRVEKELERDPPRPPPRAQASLAKAMQASRQSDKTNVFFMVSLQFLWILF